MKRHLVIFARAPQRGRVKSRLAEGIGGGAALQFYRRTLATVLRRVGRDRRWRSVLAVTPDHAARSARAWPMKLPLRRQGAGDLGVRMARALRNYPAGPVCIIGADIPDIDAPLVWRAFKALAAADVVFGPAEDGGYWLVGAQSGRRFNFFGGVRWSTKHALADTRSNLNGRRVALIERLADIDDAAAYRRWRGAR
ncbi:MAG TPA: TIGR04282 family arsenosugar biosynthesis glycosyltransferase [Alphaproteobacteria bacterium]